MKKRVAAVVVLLTFPSALVHPQAPSPQYPPPSDLRFAPPPEDLVERDLSVGAPFAFSLCQGPDVQIPQPGEALTGLNPALSPCGGDLNPSPYVSGGHPPYHFVLDSGSGFPPLGLILDMNGVLRGTPKSDRRSRFRVCAVDLSANSNCQWMTLKPQGHDPAVKRRGNPGGAVALGVLAAGAVAAAVVAGQALKNATQGQCASTRNCIVSVVAKGCECSQPTANGPCDWMGSVAQAGQGCGAGVPCQQGLSCNNGRCEGPTGRCPF